MVGVIEPGTGREVLIARRSTPASLDRPHEPLGKQGAGAIGAASRAADEQIDRLDDLSLSAGDASAFVPRKGTGRDAGHEQRKRRGRHGECHNARQPDASRGTPRE